MQPLVVKGAGQGQRQFDSSELADDTCKLLLPCRATVKEETATLVHAREGRIGSAEELPVFKLNLPLVLGAANI